jgi:hypothetical protein
MSAISTHQLAANVAWARARQVLGTSGLVGIMLCLAAASVLAWSLTRQVEVHTAEALPALPPPPAAAASISLPPVSEVPLLLTQLQLAAQAEGLGWPSAQYRVTPANDELPAGLELRLSFKAPYLAIRRFLTHVLREIPAATVKEFDISRPSADAAQVDARLGLTVFLSGDTEAVEAGK